MIKSILTAILFYFLSVSVCAQEGVEAVQKKSVEDRLIELENHQRDFEQWYSEFYLQSKQRVSPFLGEKISLGGFF